MTDKPFTWPGGCEAAISLTFDDGMRSQIEVAVPLLNKHGLCGTFYLNPRGDDWQENLVPWRAAQAAGHEMGNHTMAHACSLNYQLTLQNRTLAEVEADVVETQRRLNILFSGEKERSFAYPCYESCVGRGLTRTSFTPIIAKHLVAGRAKGLSIRANHPLNADLHHLSSWAAERMTATEMVGLIDQQAIEPGWWGIFTFHGINEGHLPVGEHDLTLLLDYLARNKKRVWTAPVAAIARYITDQA